MGKNSKNLKRMLSLGEFRLSLHAFDRSNERHVSEADMIQCGKTAKRIVYQKDRDTWKIEGKDLDHLDLTIICKFRGSLLVVTVY